MPGFGKSPENTRTAIMGELAATMAAAVTALDIDTFNLMGTSFGGKVGIVAGAVQQQERVQALVPKRWWRFSACLDGTAVGLAGGDGAPALCPS